MDQQELLGTVRTLRARRFTPAEIARAVGISKADAARLVRAVACERESQPTSNGSNHRAASQSGCWVSPGWRHGLQIDGRADWPDDAGAPSEAIDSGVACVLIAVPERPSKLSVCGYLVDTWCLGVKNAIGPRRMSQRELEAFRRQYFGPWESVGIPIPLELAQNLV
ncbi:MAG: helix-turn-helix domain-containing protein, partial [Solirubrobacteraceae bacterium]